MFRFRIATLFVGLMSMMVAAGCGGGSSSVGGGNGGNGGGGNGGGGGGTPQTPTILSFSVTPPVAAAGEFVNFAWTTANATTFSVTPSIVH